MGQTIGIETFISYISGVVVFFIGLCGGLIAYIYRSQLARSKSRWEKHEENESKWIKDFEDDTGKKFSGIITEFKDGLKEERSFRYREMIEMKEQIKELYESRKEICSRIREAKARCDERHK